VESTHLVLAAPLRPASPPAAARSLAVAAVTLVACSTTPHFTGPGGSGGSTTTASGGASTTTTSSSSTTPTASTTTTTSSSSTTTSTTSSPSWHRYTFDRASGAWSTAQLSSVWTGPNAPPSSGIVATSHLDHFDKLLVFTDGGMLHVQEAGAWKPPVATHGVFPEIAAPTAINALYHVPSDWNVTPPAQPLAEGLTFSIGAAYWMYDYHADGTATFTSSGTIAQDPPSPGPPQATGAPQWFFEIWNQSKVGTPEGMSVWGAYHDGYVYEMDATFAWYRWPVEAGPLWAGKPGAPDWATLRSAYFIGHPPDGMGVLVLLGP
jgi:hypothetical protein